MKSKPAVFFDRDGILTIPIKISGKGFAPSNLQEFELYEDSIESLQKTRDLGYLNIVVSNQPDIATGKLQIEVLKQMNKILYSKLALDLIVNCTHILQDKCECRKPNLGMVKFATEKFNIDLNNSWIIGDRDHDIEVGKRIGIRTIFIERGWVNENGSAADFKCNSLNEAVKFINLTPNSSE